MGGVMLSRAKRSGSGETGVRQPVYRSLPGALVPTSMAAPKGQDDAAASYCLDLTRDRAHSFYFATRFLPAPTRRNVVALYAFCRTVDDIADLPPANPDIPPAQTLDSWRDWLLAGAPGSPDLVRHALARVVARTGLPLQPLIELVESLIEDLGSRHVPDLPALERYAHGVAGTVGSAMAHLLGASGAAAQSHARSLGIAMQMTNVLRDIGEDQARGRIYLPAEEMARVGYSRLDLAHGVVDERFVRLMRVLVAHARSFYADGMAGIAYLPRECRFPIVLAANTYAGILTDIEKAGYNVFHYRAHTRRRDKVWLAARLSFHRGRRWLGR
ncbi:MAG TPA: phytoene/squalene synthase family protein [Chloroflexota bacterium]|nr:phytoene/squalene synthase family protein [Chloroflexota bacterium]